MKNRKILFIFMILGFLIPSVAIMAQSVTLATIPLTGTIWGSYNPDFEGKGAWVGYAMISVNGGTPSKATIADRNTGGAFYKDGSFTGTEVITLTFVDGSGTFCIDGRFSASRGMTASFYTLFEAGKISRGTGKYAKAEGDVTVVGPFIMPSPDMKAGTALWIAEIYGTISGVN
jgi:hypothetical protein